MASRHPFLAPVVLGTVAAGVLTAALVVPGHPRPVSAVIDLSENATSELAFRTDADGGYQAELEMDQPMVGRLYSCVAGIDTVIAPSCQGPSMPLDLSISIVGEKGPVVQDRYVADGARGGSFGGDTFAVLMDAGQLQPRTDYRLVVRSLRDGSALAPARPRLAVDIAPGQRDLETLQRVLTMAGAGLIATVALIWAAILAAMRLRKAGR